ncbi:restriction endonuclease [Paenibacillus larvae]|uniref:DNA topoisomerase 1 n=1 Tax=Paenibacillus larvae subsp. larvae TaxID=147375 RepID=A0A6C0QMH7_9BACL|nr:restriction endonuclease [Paenibacillus larvae]QHZ49924.1 DNA topoisomerase 1 [Paenibacillus larvae subsp. larvae]
MARRKSKAKQKEEFISTLFKLVVIVGFFGTYYLTKSQNKSIIITVILIAIVITTMLIRKLKYIQRLKKSGIRDIDQMDGRQFEYYLGYLFKSQGYAVKVTRAAGDYGADLVLKKEGKKIVVQAKRYSKNIGLEAVQQVYSSKNYYGASEAWVLSNRDYTEAASKLAKSNGVRLIGRNELIGMILKMNPESVPKPKQVIQENPTPRLTCNRCGRPMVIRKGPRGEFYGCTGFPKCRTTKAVSS